MRSVKLAILFLAASVFVFGCAAQQTSVKQKSDETAAATSATDEEDSPEMARPKTELEKSEEERKAAEQRKAEQLKWEQAAATYRKIEEERRAEEQRVRDREALQSVQVNVGYMSYKVWRARWSDRLSSNQFLDSRPNAKWLFVELSVRNNDKKARTVPPFTLIDEQGREYESSSQAVLMEDAFGIIESLNPDVSKQGVVVFDVPQNRTYKLKVSGGYWSKEDGYIPIQPR